MSFIIAQSMSSCNDFSNISLAIDISVEIEEIEEVFNLWNGECRIACNDWFSENCLSLVLDYDFTINTHSGYIMPNIIQQPQKHQSQFKNVFSYSSDNQRVRLLYLLPLIIKDSDVNKRDLSIQVNDCNDEYERYYISLLMERVVKQIRIKDRKQAPYFELTSKTIMFSPHSIIVKVLAFSIDPVMRVWLSGAKTNYRQIVNGDIFNCFGVGIIEKSTDPNFLQGQYVFGNTGTVNYLQLTEQKQRQLFVIDRSIDKWGPYRYIYLINNGLAAYAGLNILQVKKGDTVVVSTAAGATGLLFCHLLKKKQANIVAITSPSKFSHLTEYTDKIISYQDRSKLREYLRTVKYSKYFDNVGEGQLDLVISTIQNDGIIAMCGAIENYLDPKNSGINNYLAVISKRLRLEGINFSSLFWKAPQILEEYSDANIKINVVSLEDFIPYFLQIFKKGGSIVGKIVIDPHK